MELMGAVAAARLAANIEEAMKPNIVFKRRFFFTDNTSVLAMIKGDSAAYKEFVGTRVGEIKNKTKPEEEWMWIPTHDNLSDMGTRDDTIPRDLKPGTEYQAGKQWMREEQHLWPAKTSGGTVPEDEVKLAARLVNTLSTSYGLDFQYEKYSDVGKLKRVVMIVFKAFFIFKQKLVRNKHILIPSRNELAQQADNFLIVRSQSSIKEDLEKGKLSSLLPVRTTVQFADVSAEKFVTAGRLAGGMAIGYDRDQLPILPYKDCFARLLMIRAHNIEHCGVDRTVQRSRNFAWIVRARKLAKFVRSRCFRCKLNEKNMVGQKMAPLPASRLPPATVFNSTAVDLFGPILIKDTVKGRTKKGCWGVIFVCTVTSAIHLEVTENYSCDQFLLALRRFVNSRGTPSRFQSDPGTQLVAASKQYLTWDFARIQEWAHERDAEWYITPTDSQHYNGCAESMIRVTKKQLSNTLKSTVLTKGELDTLFSDVMFIVNSRPLMKGAGDDPLSCNPVTPLHLLGGRCTISIPDPMFDMNASLTKRLKFMEEIKRDFWKKWYMQVFHNLVPSYKWKRAHRDVQVGDIVLLRESNPIKCEYKLARVKEVSPGEDGRVRRVTLIYKNLKETGKDVNSAVRDLQSTKFSETERSVQNIAVIVPADWTEPDIEEAVTQGLKVYI